MEARELKKRLQEEIERLCASRNGNNFNSLDPMESLLIKYDSDVDEWMVFSDSFNSFSFAIDPEATLEAWQELPDGSSFETALDAAVESE